MRLVVFAALLVGGVVLVGFAWDAGERVPTPQAGAWRRTAEGWERLPIRTAPSERPPVSFPPISLAAVQGLAVLLLAASQAESPRKEPHDAGGA